MSSTTSAPTVTTSMPNKPSSLYFSGFNGFGQFASCAELVAHTPTEFRAPGDDCDQPPPIVACTWAYNAIAHGHQLWLCGATGGEVAGRTTCHQLPAVICKLAANDRVCLVLLATGAVHKVCISTGAMVELNFITTEADGNQSPVGVASVSRKRVFPGEREAITSGGPPLEPEMVADIACAHTFSVALTTRNALYCVPSVVHRFGGRERIVKMCAGAEHVLLLTGNGDVYVFGSSLRGQLGQGDTADESAPILLDALAGIKITDIGAGAWHSAAVSAFGDLYTWGWNPNGQTGRAVYETKRGGGDNDDDENASRRRKLPTVFATADVIDLPAGGGDVEEEEKKENEEEVANLEHQFEVQRVWCGGRHTIVQTRCGRWLACGWNRYGQLGDTGGAECGANEECFVDNFVEIEDLPAGVADVVCGSWCSVFFVK